MNDKDKEAFDKWWISNKYQLSPFYWHDTSLVGSEILATWQAACEYKQAELAHHIFKIECENKKLREALEFYANCTRLMLDVKDLPIDPIIDGPMFSSKSIMDNGDRAREALKEVGEE